MNIWNIGLVYLLSLLELVYGRQFCGSDLANIMQLVCDGRGYNMAFRPDSSAGEKRFKRGIVDECCRRGCSWSTLETYCSPTPSNIQIRKRSDFPSKWQPDSSEDQSNIDTFKYNINMKRDESDLRKLKIAIDNDRAYSKQFVETRDQNNRHTVQKNRGHVLVNKVKRNDIGEDLVAHSKRGSISFGINCETVKMEGGKSGEPLEQLSPRIAIRHRHRKADVLQKSAKENSNGQVGTVPPYFLGRTLVLPSTRTV